MAIEPNDKDQYTAQDIERYHTGGMTAQERHALEKAALDDPFLADALEGYKLTATPAADVIALRALLDQKTGKSKVVPISAGRKRVYPLLRIAALLLLLLGAGWSVYYLMDTKRETLALDPKERTAPVSAPTPALDSDTASVSPSILQTETVLAPPEVVKEATSATPKKVESRMEDQDSEEAVAVQPTATVPPAETPMLFRADTTINDVAVVQRQLQGNAAGIQSRAANATNSFSGRVVDANNQGIPSASVVIRNSNTVATTDQRGYFSLNTPDTAITARVGAVGFEGKDITLNNRNAEANIVLNESAQSLQEVVVTGVSPQRKRSAVGASTSPALSEPVTGWLDFHNYVANKRKTVQDSDGTEAKGAVTLTFTVNRQGTPTNIKVESASSSTLVTEAIRLLKTGPKWDRKKSNRGRVTINFE